MVSMTTTDFELRHFVVFQDHDAKTWSVEEFPEDHRDAAFERLFALERAFGYGRSIGVILLGAKSLDTLRYTHGDLFWGEQTEPPVIAPVDGAG